jgi:hypothetical protein
LAYANAYAYAYAFPFTSGGRLDKGQKHKARSSSIQWNIIIIISAENLIIKMLMGLVMMAMAMTMTMTMMMMIGWRWRWRWRWRKVTSL